jgi:hypothetical protein
LPIAKQQKQALKLCRTVHQYRIPHKVPRFKRSPEAMRSGRSTLQESKFEVDADVDVIELPPRTNDKVIG